MNANPTQTPPPDPAKSWINPFTEEERKRFGLPSIHQVDILAKKHCSPVAVYYYTESYVGTNGICACTHCATFDGINPHNYAVICYDLSISESIAPLEDEEEGVIYCN